MHAHLTDGDPVLGVPHIALSKVPSKDGTLIAVQCAGAGPSLIIVHGGTGDRSRWTPLVPAIRCALQGLRDGSPWSWRSGDSPDYSLQKEAEDVVAVINSQPGQVFLMGHSYGGVCALEAAFLTSKISKLVLYEPPLEDPDHSAITDRMESMIRAGQREQALTTFMLDIVHIALSELAAMKARSSWLGLVQSVDASIRKTRALVAYRFDPERIRTLMVPTLLLTGSETTSPQLKQAVNDLMDALPERTFYAFGGQQHNAMDTVPRQFAEVVNSFLLGQR